MCCGIFYIFEAFLFAIEEGIPLDLGEEVFDESCKFLPTVEEEDAVVENVDTPNIGVREGFEKDSAATELPTENKVEDSGILSGVATSDESNQNTDEENSCPLVDSPNEELASLKEQEIKPDSDINQEVEESMAEEDSLKLVLEPDTPVLGDEEIVKNSQVFDEESRSKEKSRLELLKSRINSSELEETVDVDHSLPPLKYRKKNSGLVVNIIRGFKDADLLNITPVNRLKR